MIKNSTNSLEINTKQRKLYYIENNIEYVFIPIINKLEDSLLYKGKPFRYDELPDILYGKIFRYIGYNPSGWWSYLNVNKKELLYK